MNSRPYLLHALSPLHAGTGQGVDVIDLPIARMKATRIPFVPGSTVKGVLRWTRRPDEGAPTDDFFATFGPETENAAEHAGAVMFGDARLLLLPVRSFVGTFAFVTSPLLLHLASRDLKEAGIEPPVLPSLKNAPKALVGQETLIRHDKRVFLEDLDLPAEHGAPVDARGAVPVDAWGAVLGPLVFPGTEPMLSHRLVIVDDDTMSFLWETATQVDARIRIDPDTRTVEDGALWYEESLPPESVLIGLMIATNGMRWIQGENSRRRHPWSAHQALDLALPGEEILQFGGNASVGRGRCRIFPIPPGGPSGGKESQSTEVDHG